MDDIGSKFTSPGEDLRATEWQHILSAQPSPLWPISHCSSHNVPISWTEPQLSVRCPTSLCVAARSFHPGLTSRQEPGRRASTPTGGTGVTGSIPAAGTNGPKQETYPFLPSRVLFH